MALSAGWLLYKAVLFSLLLVIRNEKTASFKNLNLLTFNNPRSSENKAPSFRQRAFAGASAVPLAVFQVGAFSVNFLLCISLTTESDAGSGAAQPTVALDSWPLLAILIGSYFVRVIVAGMHIVIGLRVQSSAPATPHPTLASTRSSVRVG